ncbi:LOW QUALITY PROTEIN: hypothetical protein PHMEG_0009049 [Phytophthora megakarya]|uniref:Transposase n=1 Tax=Phytophthora megakarya TaxID=4795 RepID=A0A225WHG4_9STRA|nr:LOW QUALITY PROTEIN: hypothetical protein PHMEG_0009049 [Phytophthora megakarya]
MNSNELQALPFPYMYHLPDEGLFAMDKVLEATANETLCMKWCMEIGGDGKVVEIDETSLAKKHKYHRGRHYEEFWLFGGRGELVGGLVVWVYNKRKKATSLSIIKRFIKPRSTYWNSY